MYITAGAQCNILCAMFLFGERSRPISPGIFTKSVSDEKYVHVFAFEWLPATWEKKFGRTFNVAKLTLQILRKFTVSVAKSIQDFSKVLYKTKIRPHFFEK